MSGRIFWQGAGPELGNCVQMLPMGSKSSYPGAILNKRRTSSKIDKTRGILDLADHGKGSFLPDFQHYI